MPPENKVSPIKKEEQLLSMVRKGKIELTSDEVVNNFKRRLTVLGARFEFGHLQERIEGVNNPISYLKRNFGSTKNEYLEELKGEVEAKYIAFPKLCASMKNFIDAYTDFYFEKNKTDKAQVNK